MDSDTLNISTSSENKNCHRSQFWIEKNVSMVLEGWLCRGLRGHPLSQRASDVSPGHVLASYNK